MEGSKASAVSGLLSQPQVRDWVKSTYSGRVYEIVLDLGDSWLVRMVYTPTDTSLPSSEMVISKAIGLEVVDPRDYPRLPWRKATRR